MNKTTFITTFNEIGYELYGKAWIKTFIEKTTNQNVYAKIYCENFTPDPVDCERIDFLDFYKEIPEHLEWKIRYVMTTPHLKYTKNMTVRFSFKAFVIQHALQNIDSDYIIWLDGDCIFTGNDYENLASEIIGDCLLACQVEKYKDKNSNVGHIESGILVFNAKHNDKNIFLEKHKEYYKIENINLMPNDSVDLIIDGDTTWTEHGPYDGFIMHKTISNLNLKIVNLNNDDTGVNSFIADPNETFTHPSLKYRFVHNIGHIGKNNYPSLNKELQSGSNIQEWDTLNTDEMNNIQNNVVTYELDANFNNKTFKFIIHDPSIDVIVSRHIWQHKSWEREISQLILDNMKPNSLFVDIGANIGWHTKLVQEHGYNTISFEPEPSNWNVLTQNCTKENCQLYNTAIGEKHESVKFKLDKHNYGNSCISEDGDIAVNVMTLDNVIDHDIAKTVSVIKIDVQGYEHNVVLGGKEFFKSLNQGTTIIMEVSPNKLGRNLKHLGPLLSRASSSYAMCFFPEEGKTNILSFNEATKLCLNPTEEMMQIWKRKEVFEFDLVITL